MIQRSLLLAVAGVLILSGVGCTQQQTPPAPVTPTSSQANEQWRPKDPLPREILSTEEANNLRRGYLEQRAKQLGVEAATAPALVRWIYPDQIGEVRTACMRQRGFAVAPSSGGTGVTGQAPPSQESAFNQALFACEAEYTIDARAMRPPSQALLGAVYDYTVEWLIPCLARNGHEGVNPPSSRVTFIASGGQWDGYPFGDDTLLTRCPPQPPNAVVFGE